MPSQPNQSAARDAVEFRCEACGGDHAAEPKFEASARANKFLVGKPLCDSCGYSMLANGEARAV